MAWPKPRNRRSPASPASNGNGAAAAEPASTAAASEQATWSQPAPAEAGAAEAGAAEAGAAEAGAADQADVPFWSWGRSAEPDDPADGLQPDRPEYPDGPDPEYADDPGYPSTIATADADRGSRTWPEPTVTPVETAGEEREGIGQHLGNLAHLSGDPRMRAWQRRAIIALVAGVAFGLLLKDWRWGLTFAVLAAIADTIYRSRTVFNGPAGVKLTRAQRNTVRQLARMERKGYRAIHCAPIPNSEDQIDHLVVGPAGVFAIDSEDWDRRTPVRTSSHRQLWHGSQNMKHRLEQAHWEADQAAELLSASLGRPVSVRPTMAIYGPKLAWDVVEVRDVDVFRGTRLRKYLKRRNRQTRKHHLPAAEIERIDKAMHEVFPHDPAG
jgi:hypothetical protein